MRDGYVTKLCTRCGRTFEGKGPCRKRRRGQECGGTRASWSFRVDTAPAGAPRRQITRSGFPTRKAALEALHEIQEAVRTGTHVEPSKLATGEYLEAWVRGVQVRESTRDSYESHVRNYLVPRLGEIPLQALTREAIKRAYADLGKRGAKRTGGPLAPMTIHHVHVTLHKALEDAVEDRLIPRNPADKAHKAPKSADREEMRVWSEGEVRDFFRAVAGDRLAALWRFLVMTGCRRGEAIGLRWSDVDLGAGTVTFTRQRSRQGDKGVVDGPTKTGRGRRTVDLDPGTVEALETWAGAQLVEALEWGEAYQDSGLVFTREDGSPLDPDGTSSRWNRLVKASGLPRIRLHDARHTSATLWLRAGVSPHVVSQRLGHASVAFTLQQYAHVLPHQQAEAAAKVAELIDG